VKLSLASRSARLLIPLLLSSQARAAPAAAPSPSGQIVLPVQSENSPVGNGADESRIPAMTRQEDPPEDGRHVTWRRAGIVDYAMGAAFLAGYFLFDRVVPWPTHTSWTEPLPLIDRPVRDAVVAHARAARDRNGRRADLLWHGMQIAPFIDALAVPLVRRADARYVWELEWMNLEFSFLAAFDDRAIHKIVPRTRPAEIGCEDNPDYSSKCGGHRILSSFWAGHVSTSFTGAGLICAHHIHAHVYGDDVADGVACGVALAAGTAVGYLRLLSDEHWMSDVLVGTAVGLGAGYALPTYLFYHPFWRASPRAPFRPQDPPPVQWAAYPTVFTGGMGVVAGGIF
jgi:membrane-associated phospholipid phosphatase